MYMYVHTVHIMIINNMRLECDIEDWYKRDGSVHVLLV